MASPTTHADHSWRIGLYGRLALLVGLLAVAVGLARLAVVPGPGPVKVPVVAVAVGDSETEPFEVTVEDNESEFVGPPTPRQERSRHRMAAPVYTDVRFSVHFTVSGTWVIRELGGVFWGCTGLDFSDRVAGPCGKDNDECDSGDSMTIDFWPGNSDDYVTQFAGQARASASAPSPTDRLRAALLAELRRGPRDKVVLLTISATDNLTFGALWPFEQLGRELMRGEGQDGALEVQYQDANLLLPYLAGWQVKGHAPPGY